MILCYNDCIQNATNKETFIFIGVQLYQYEIDFTFVVIFQLDALFDNWDINGIKCELNWKEKALKGHI